MDYIQMDINDFKKELNSFGNKNQAIILRGFFKTGKGQYGEGDIFLGIKVPIQRNISKKYDLELSEIQELFNSKIHEHRLCALFILIEKYKKSSNKKQIFDFYLKNTKNVNNWDLVDLSAHNIIGNYLLDKDRFIIHKLANSDNLWKKRISIIATFAFIRNHDFSDCLKISKILLNDKHDLIHKAVGWMLREVGKRDMKVEEDFLKKYHKTMPRTMLRYAIENFPESKRKVYMRK